MVDMTITSALLLSVGSIKPGASGARGGAARRLGLRSSTKYKTRKTEGYVGVSSLTRA